MIAKLTLILTLVAMSVFALNCGGGSDGDSSASSGDRVGTQEFGMTDEELVNAIEEGEALIATCMAEQGFEYAPIDPVSFREAMDALTEPTGLSNEEFVEQYGYGISTMPPSQGFGAGPENDATLESLSDADRTAYLRALTGENRQATFVFTLENEDFEDVGGCTEAAVEEVFTDEQLNPNFVNPFDRLVAQDPRMVAAVEEWSDCMRESGYDFDTPDDAEDEIVDRLDNLLDGRPIESLTSGDADELASIQSDERAIAGVDLICQEEHLLDVEEQVERDISGQN